MRVAALALTLLAAGTLPAGAASAAKAKPKRCSALTPRALVFERPSGGTAGVLRWKPAARASRRAKTRFRVYRGAAVVGQTPRRTMRIRVRVGRTYTLTVTAVTAQGRATRCRARIVVRDSYRLPSAPRMVTVGAVEGASTTISWEPSKPGDSPVAAYRVRRDGGMYRQTRGTTVAVPLSSNRSASFTVTAVDRRGVLSPASEAVRISTGHTPPPTPVNVRVSEVTDTAVALQWTPSVPARGRLAGYRIIRDGTPLFQVGGASARATNLWASREYTFRVQAVDTLGGASAPSAPLTVRTADPDPTEGRLHAFLLASTDQSFRDFQAHYRQIATVHPTYYDCTTAAVLIGKDDPLITGWAQARRVEVLPRFNCQRTAVLNRILNEPALRETWLDGIVERVTESGADGASLDFEAGLYTDRAALTSFVADLADRLHGQGQRLTIAVSAKTADVPRHPRSTFFDYKALAESADQVFVMAWGIKWATSGPGAQDDITWVTRVADYVKTMPDPSRFVMGTQLYAMDWPSGGGAAHPATSYEYADAVAMAQATGSTMRLDPVTDGMTFSYAGSGGVPHEVWLADAATVERRFALATARGLGIGVWRLGQEDQRLWTSPLLAPVASGPAP
ncbi:MAG TPA: fibronectin type III domain-containing protein [Solirubrobacteraceae bacterium]|nr:fibronectin type III domain-containing protein [Solirubrobacteraceae bacterium]